MVQKIKQAIRPEFFDIFGAPAFLFLAVLSIWALQGNEIPQWALVVVLAIGALGLAVDGIIVYKTYLKRRQ